MTHATEAFQPLQTDDPPMVGGYRLAARLGAGGMGRVYLSHTQGGRPVAIKVVRPELADDPGFRRRFSREIKAARRVKGAYTAELIDADGDGVPPWLATLYVPGPSLTQAVDRNGPLPVPAVLWLMAGVAEALQAIHGAGIVHRDLKPSNVLLAADGPRVIDFGIAVAADGTAHTATGAAIGTPQFMAPEQASGSGDVTAATDVFALGQTAAFAALGRPLYGDGPSVSVLYRIVHSEPDLTRLPEPLREPIGRCLAADPAKRITPAEVVAWCRRLLGPDADAGAGPAVWREIAGPPTTVPPPAPAAPRPAPAHPHAPVPHAPAPHTLPFTAPLPAAGPAFPPAPGQRTDPGRRPGRGRRTALVVGAGVTAGLLLLAGVTWTVMDAVDRLADRNRARDTAASGPSGGTASGAPGRASAGSSATGGGSAPEASPGTGSAAAAGAGTGADAGRPPSASGAPRALALPPVWLDGKTSTDLTDMDLRKDRKGDIRLDCAGTGCALESDAAVFKLLYGEPGATYETCRSALDGDRHDGHRLPLAAAAQGSEICVRNRNGDIALLVLTVKSTALPDIAFVTADRTVWRAA